MKKFLFVFSVFMLAFTGMSVAQSSIEGLWYVKGDSGPRATAKHANKEFAVIKIEKNENNGTYYAILKERQNGLAEDCQNCPGENANKKTVGMMIAKGFKPTPGKTDEWEAGWAINPENGKEATGVKGKLVNPNNLDLIITDSDGTKRTLKLRRKS